MKQALAQAVAQLVLHGDEASAGRLDRFSGRDWKRSDFWLDTSGLALHLIDRLICLDAVSLLPAPLAARLQQNLADSDARVATLLAELGRINDAFRRLGLPYAMHKGFNLCPEFCADPRLRLQFDFDFYIRREDHARFDSAARAIGYHMVSATDREAKYDTHPGRYDRRSDIYRPPTRFGLELHFDVNAPTRVRTSRWPDAALAQAHLRNISGVLVPVLSRAHQLIDHADHIFAHASGGWVRLAWLCEWLYFQRKHSHDDALWCEVKTLAETERLSDEIGFASELAAAAFSTSFPQQLGWAQDRLSPALQAWTRLCGREFALAAYPGSKLNLLAAAEFGMTPEETTKKLFPVHRPNRYYFNRGGSALQRANTAVRQHMQILRRILFHCNATCRYWKFRIRWTRLQARPN